MNPTLPRRLRARLAAAAVVAGAGLLGTTITSPVRAGPIPPIPPIPPIEVITIPPGPDGTIDLTVIDDSLDKVYALVPSPSGPIEILIEAAEANAVTVNGVDGQQQSSSPCNQQARQSPGSVWGTANPPQRYTEYSDSTGHRYSYVQGSARIKSCMTQDFYISVQQMAGLRVFKSTGLLRVRAPGDKWITFWSPTMPCEPQGNPKGYSYRTYLETFYRSSLGGGSPEWQSTSDDRYWSYC